MGNKNFNRSAPPSGSIPIRISILHFFFTASLILILIPILIPYLPHVILLSSYAYPNLRVGLSNSFFPAIVFPLVMLVGHVLCRLYPFLVISRNSSHTTIPHSSVERASIPTSTTRRLSFGFPPRERISKIKSAALPHPLMPLSCRLFPPTTLLRLLFRLLCPRLSPPRRRLLRGGDLSTLLLLGPIPTSTSAPATRKNHAGRHLSSTPFPAFFLFLFPLPPALLTRICQ